MKTRWWTGMELRRTIFMLSLSLMLCLAQLVISHMTHSLTLLVATYHMLYNIVALVGCIATIKVCQRQYSLSNTFGWARLEVLSMVVNLLFLGALCFSLVVEAVQTIVQYDSKDATHEPLTVIYLTSAGFVVNFICIILIGGYTHHQGSFLTLTPEGDVKIHVEATEEALRCGLRRMETVKPVEGADTRSTRKWPKFRSVFRDTISLVIVLIASVVVHLYGEESMVSVMIDPVLAILSVAILSYTSYPFMLQAGQILLQTAPDHIDVKRLESQLKKTFPMIVNVHDFHVWALTPGRVISTVHLVFLCEADYHTYTQSIRDFFLSKGITRLTVQPELYQLPNPPPSPDLGCILPCSEDSCSPKSCCGNQPNVVAVTNDIESATEHYSSSDHSGSCDADAHPPISYLTQCNDRDDDGDQDIPMDVELSNEEDLKPEQDKREELEESVEEPLLNKAD